MMALSSSIVKPSISAHSIRKVCDLFLHGSDISPPRNLNLEGVEAHLAVECTMSTNGGWAGVGDRANATVHTG